MSKVLPGTYDSVYETNRNPCLDKCQGSRKPSRDFISYCLRKKLVSGTDALELKPILKSKLATRTFVLADLSYKEHFRMGLGPE